MAELVLSALLLAAVVWSLGRRQTISNPRLQLMRVLVPAWRFFDEVGPAPVLWVRTRVGKAPFSPFLPALPAPPRRLVRALWNPEGNLHLAHCALLERLIAELAELDERAARPERLVTYQLVTELARAALRTRSEEVSFQFRLTLFDPGGAGTHEEVVRSAIHPACP